MINRLSDYIEDENEILYDVDVPAENGNNQCQFFRKLRYRIGSIVILANALERIVENCLLEMMNERAEDSRIWILIQDFNLDKKIDRLKLIYIETIRITHDKNVRLLQSVEEVFSRLSETRQRRNLYIHSNWLNNFNLKYFETKVKKIQRKEGYFRVRKKITLDDLDVLIAEIEAVTNDLEELHETIFESG